MDKQTNTGGSTDEPTISDLEKSADAQNQVMQSSNPAASASGAAGGTESAVVSAGTADKSNMSSAAATPAVTANITGGTGNAVSAPVPASEVAGDGSKKNGTLQVMAFVLGIVIIILLFLLVLYSIINGGGTVTPTPTVAPTSAGQTPAAANLTVSKPEGEGTVNGKILVEGVASVSLTDLTIQVFDNDGTVLGVTNVNLTGNANQTSVTYSIFLELEKGPASAGGYVQVYPTEAGKTSALTKTVAVVFEASTSERVKVYAPLKNMKYTGGAVLFRGEMKDFFEGSMGLRLIGGNGGILYDTSIQSQGDNYGQFAGFEKMVNPGTIPSTAGGNGKWEFYDTSMADGSVTVLVTVPVSL